MSGPSLPELLRFIAEHESLPATVSAFPSLDAPALRERLREAATRLESKDAGFTPVSLETLPAEGTRGSGGSRARASGSGADATPSASAAPAPKGTPQKGAGLPRSSSAAKRVRVYSDGAARGNPGLSGAGAVITTPDGEVIERLGKFLGTQTNNVAEYTALLLGLEHAKRLGADAVDVFADSELMIRQLEGRYQVKAPGLKPLFDKALALLRSFQDVKLQHIPRAQNADADEMSNRAIDERM